MTTDNAAILANDLLTPAEIQRVLRCGKNALYNSIKSGDIPSFRFGGFVSRTRVLVARPFEIAGDSLTDFDLRRCASRSPISFLS
jgi:hypothetical protein